MKIPKRQKENYRYPAGFFQNFYGGHIDVKVGASKQNLPFSLKSVHKFVDKILKEEHFRLVNLTILLMGRGLMRSLNKRFLSRDESTDCLAFDLKPSHWPRNYIFGDIVVSVDAAKNVSKAGVISFQEELCRYIIHGILHLTGFDDTLPAKRKKMWERQEELTHRFVKFLNSK